MSQRPIQWATLAAGGGAFILLVCGPISYDLLLAREAFAICLAILTVSAVALFRQGHRYHAALALVVMVTLLWLSFRTVYVRHWTPWDGGHSHRHTMWDLGHVH